jgi:hypothetical protein
VSCLGKCSCLPLRACAYATRLARKRRRCLHDLGGARASPRRRRGIAIKG